MEIMNSNNERYKMNIVVEKCWNCDIPLVNVADDKWKCLECDDVYWLCWFCAKENKYEWDCDSVKKGWQCGSCFHHGCVSCTQFGGEFDDDDCWFCPNCEKPNPEMIKQQRINNMANKIRQRDLAKLKNK